MYSLVSAVCINGGVLLSLKLDLGFGGDLVVLDGRFVGVW